MGHISYQLHISCTNLGRRASPRLAPCVNLGQVPTWDRCRVPETWVRAALWDKCRKPGSGLPWGLPWAPPACLLLLPDLVSGKPNRGWGIAHASSPVHEVIDARANSVLQHQWSR